jgi:hypothetical protein
MNRRWQAWRRGLIVFLCCAAMGAALSLPIAHVSGRRHGRATKGLDCAVCHTPAGWQMPRDLRTADGFDHDRTGFPLRGGHLRAACVQCHQGRAPLKRECNQCHVDEHGGKLGNDCDRCHQASSFRSTDAFSLHRSTRLPLTGMHALVDCADCHRRTTAQSYTAVPSQCFACHEDDYRRPDLHPVHDGSSGAAPLSRNCAECHRTFAFSPAVIDADRFLGGAGAALQAAPPDHDRSFVLSRGPHRGAPCASCHAAPSAPRLVRCTGCHAHNPALLDRQHPRLPQPQDGTCLACHQGGFAR